MGKRQKYFVTLGIAMLFIALAAAVGIFSHLNSKKTVVQIEGSLIPFSFEEMCKESQTVVHATVMGKGETTRLYDCYYTPVEVQVHEVLKGNENLEELTFMELFGETEDRIYYYYPQEWDNYPIQPGTEIVLFLYPKEPGKDYYFNYHCGIYEVTDDTVKVGESEGILTRSAGEEEEMSIQDFRQLVLEKS